jgi:hypothetical protein
VSCNTVWQPVWLRELDGDTRVIGHCDTGPWNIIGSNHCPQAFIDWEFAGLVDPLWELAETTWLNAQLHDDDIAELHELPDAATRARQVRAIIDGYGLAGADREHFYDRLLDVAVHSARAEVLAWCHCGKHHRGRCGRVPHPVGHRMARSQRFLDRPPSPTPDASTELNRRSARPECSHAPSWRHDSEPFEQVR